ncbi:MAG: hypothetical protein M3Y50_10590 [Acidobacteriota bacterium]|nr:hypothetical protein [Acidobacteriota bacterium]
MGWRGFAVCVAVLGATVPLIAEPPAASSADFTLSSPSHIPGSTLEAGSYSIHVVNRLSDRVILSVDAASGTVHTTFLGIANRSIARPASSGPVRWRNPADGATYLEGWYFPGSSTVVEFVYPKAEAVAIATANQGKVPAIDPASEGVVADKTLSKDEMKLLTLWMLSFEPVGAGDTTSSGKAIKAVRYQETVSVPRKPVIAALPHTASWMPVVGLGALLSLTAAAFLRILLSRNGLKAQEMVEWE